MQNCESVTMRDDLSDFDNLPSIGIGEAVEILMRGEPILRRTIPDLAKLITAFHQRLETQGEDSGEPIIRLHGCRVSRFDLTGTSSVRGHVTIALYIGPTPDQYWKTPEEATPLVCDLPESVQLVNVTFHEPLMIVGSRIAVFTCHKVCFKGTVRFDGTVFSDHFACEECHFKNAPSFYRADVQAIAWLRKNIFHKGAEFLNAHFALGARLEESQFLGHSSLRASQFGSFAGMGLKLGDARRRFAIFSDPSSGEEAFRIAKNHAQAAGDYLLVGDYYYQERVHRRKRLWKRWHPWRLAEWLLIDRVFGYGERPRRVLYTAVAVIALWALFFLFSGVRGSVGSEFVTVQRQLRPDRTQIWPTVVDYVKCLYFSGITLATVGYGDIQPIGFWSRLFAVIEGLIGIVLAALFAVTVAKRFGRG
jgi:hypothetical protein